MELESIRWQDGYVPVVAGSTAICRHDANVRSIPPTITFTGKTWADVHTKLLAICPNKIPENITPDIINYRPE